MADAVASNVIELHLLRHAHAGDPMAWDGPDERRPLSDKGEKQADRLGRFLAGVGFAADAVITSPKVRAAQTAEMSESKRLVILYTRRWRDAGARSCAVAAHSGTSTRCRNSPGASRLRM